MQDQRDDNRYVRHLRHVRIHDHVDRHFNRDIYRNIHEHWYVNRDNGTAPRVVVYAPPGYGASTQSYPVLYLLHGANDFERGWTQAGRANWMCS